MELPAGIDRICLNAGGAYGGMHELSITNTYIPTLGHALLLEQLLEMKKIPDGESKGGQRGAKRHAHNKI